MSLSFQLSGKSIAFENLMLSYPELLGYFTVTIAGGGSFFGSSSFSFGFSNPVDFS